VDNSRIKDVSKFFSDEKYLKNQFNIELRKTIIKELVGENIVDKSILDIGCGDGSLSLPFVPDNQIYLVDSSAYMISRANKNMAGRASQFSPVFINDDFLEYDFEEKFDLIICVGVVSHISDINQLLLKIKQLLSSSGTLIIQMSDISHRRYRNSTDGLKDYGYKLNRFDKKEFIEKLEHFGYIIKGQKGYSWSFFPINRLEQSLQFKILNSFRKMRSFNFLNSEWLFAVSTENSQATSI
jgi:SAM-dependent methyltransferase